MINVRAAIPKIETMFGGMSESSPFKMRTQEVEELFNITSLDKHYEEIRAFLYTCEIIFIYMSKANTCGFMRYKEILSWRETQNYSSNTKAWSHDSTFHIQV